MRTVSGLDVHKDSIFMCILDEQGKKREEKFGVTTREIKRLSSVMHTHYVSKVCMESTGIYWIPILIPENPALSNNVIVFLLFPTFYLPIVSR